MEGQLFSYTFTLPANFRKYLDQLKRGKGPRKARTTTSNDTQAKDLKTKEQTVLPAGPGKAEVPEQPGPKKTPEERRKYERARSQTPERQEYHRQYRRAQNQIARETGKCKDCSNPAIPNQTRCEACAEKHRASRRRSDAERSARKSRQRR